MTPAGNKKAAQRWIGYAFAVAVTGFVIALRLKLARMTGEDISLPLFGLAAVISSAQVGMGPGILASVLTAIWYVREIHAPGFGGRGIWFHYIIYALEAALMCIFARRLRTARDEAATGEAFHRNVVETAAEGIWTVDPEGVIGYANPRIAEILGCRVEEITGRKVEAFLFPEDIPLERIRFQNRRPGVKEQYDRRLRRADGSEAWTLACVSPYAYRGKDAGALTMMTDITERKKAEQALRRSERKFRELFENIREGVYQTTPDGRILEANPELLRMLGFSSPDELNLPGVVQATFVDPDIHPYLREKLERDGSYSNMEFQLRTRDHRIITVRENARVVRDENGSVLYYEGTLTDITEQLLLEKQLGQAQKMEALGRLAGGIARDFRGVGVGMVNGLQHVLDALPADHPVRPHLDKVMKALHGAAGLTRQILDFSQRQAGGRETGDVIDFNSFLERLEPALRRLLNPGTPLVFLLHGDSLTVHADAGHLQQVVTSFVVHAREFGTGAKQIEIQTGVAPHDPAGGAGPFASLSVRQTSSGTGGDTEFRPWIGMATTQAILAQYGGTMTAAIESGGGESGPGVRYSLFLPLAAGPAAEISPVDSAPSESGVDALTVMLIEEDALVRELSRDMLERLGYRVLTASSVVGALRLVERGEKIRVLILDRTVDSNGQAGMLRSLRDACPGLKLLFISGDADDASGPGEGQVLRKPFSGEALGRKLRSLLESED